MIKKFLALAFVPLIIFSLCAFEPQASLETSPEASLEAPLEMPRKEIALTFDDGPHAKYTPMILDVLAKYNAKATFFMLGDRVKAHENIVRRIAAEGHEIGNHTFTHLELTGSESRVIANELDRANAVITEVTGKTPVLMRPPTGSHSKRTDALAAERGMSVILWDIDPFDWKYLDSDRTYNYVMKRAKPGSIILMHDFYAATVDATDRLLKTLTEQGYKFVTVSEMLENPEPGKVYKADMTN